MNKKSLITAAVIIIAPVVIYLLWPSDEDRIRRLMKKEIAAVESEIIDDVMKGVSFNYSDRYGLSYALLKRFLSDYFERYSGIDIEYADEDIEVKVSGEKAEVVINVRVIATLGNDTGYFIGDIREAETFRFFLDKKAMGKWLVVNTIGPHMGYRF